MKVSEDYQSHIRPTRRNNQKPLRLLRTENGQFHNLLLLVR
ncbi:Uncharacterized protein dnm_030270 [Desulfonema magnum]|uniref:Uncharacterized protein n=1 Tax=Desulfonema magnum TaxID=45655 RepID=A0A975GMS0_9BACT|nr:Uncharacterized protein dnm_030270 [Desulfonema magnum]